jgi:hypothetical protein
MLLKTIDASVECGARAMGGAGASEQSVHMIAPIP